MMSIKTEAPTLKFRWLQTHDLDNLVRMKLQQMWIVTTRMMDDVPVSQDEEWRDIPVVNGGLEI
jgi:hypothetical protein